MTFEPIGNSDHIQFHLSKPNKDDIRILTVKWGDRKVTYRCPLVNDSSKSFSWMNDRSDFLTQASENEVIPLKLRPGLTVYVYKSENEDQKIEQLQRALSIFEIENEFERWRDEMGISLEEQQNRKVTCQRIEEYWKNGETKLDLSGLKLTSLPEALGKLTDLTTLDLHDNRLVTLPETFRELINLTTLDLSLNRLATLPETFGKLINLTKLDLSNNSLITLPDCIWELINLTKLDLSENRLATLPETFGKLTQFTWLNLRNNRLITLPDCIWELVNLTELNLSENQLTALPDGIEKLTKLTLLDIGDNRLVTLPKTLGKLTDLTNLYLPNNQLTTLPDGIEKLTNLTELDLSNNRLVTLPETFGKLINLTKLYLCYNRLTTLPASINQLTALKNDHAAFFSNPYRSLPESILSMPADLSIDLSDHNLSEQVLNNLRSLITERTNRGLLTPYINFDTPPHRSGLDPRPLYKTIAQLQVLAQLESLDFEISAFEEPYHPARLWLNNLLETSDFTHGNADLKKQLALVVLNQFRYAASHPEFQSSFNAFLEEAVVSCVDRITLSVIELEIIISLKEKTSQRIDPKEMVSLLKSVWAIHLLHQIADKKFQALKLSNELDVYLAFLIHCKKPLSEQGIQLPFTSEHMMFFGITRVDKSDLQAATEKVINTLKSLNANRLLVEFLFLKNDLNAILASTCLDLFKATFDDEVQKIDAVKQEALESILSNSSINESQKLQAIGTLNLKEQQQYVRILNQLQRSS